MFIATLLLELSCAITFCLETGRTLDSPSESRGYAAAATMDISTLSDVGLQPLLTAATIESILNEDRGTCAGCFAWSMPLTDAQGIGPRFAVFSGERAPSEAYDGALWRSWLRPL